MANLFQERIQSAIAKGGHRDAENPPPKGVHTIGEFMSAVFSITSDEDAKAFYDGYVSYLAQQPELHATPEEVARSNIGWCFGEGMALERIAMWVKACGAAHPVFGAWLGVTDG